jgi:hypothetical protein
MAAPIARTKEQLGNQLLKDAEAVSTAGANYATKPTVKAIKAAGRIYAGGAAEFVTQFHMAIEELSRIAVYAMALADMLARYRVARSTVKQNTEAGYVLRNGAWTRQHLYDALNEKLPEFLTMPFEQAITSMAALDPILVKHMNEAYEAYVGRKFWMERSTSKRITTLVQQELTRALKSGMSAASFLEALDTTRAAEMGDAYLRTVFRTNVLTAQTAGRIKMLADPDLEGFIVGLEYSARMGNPTPPRENHAGMDGWRGALGHEVWKVWLPPNGFNCRCTVMEITRPDAEAMNKLDARGKFKSDRRRKWQPDDGFATSPAAEIYS